MYCTPTKTLEKLIYILYMFSKNEKGDLHCMVPLAHHLFSYQKVKKNNNNNNNKNNITKKKKEPKKKNKTKQNKTKER